MVVGGIDALRVVKATINSATAAMAMAMDGVTVMECPTDVVVTESTMALKAH